MIAVRKEISAFADINNRDLLDVDNPHLFVFHRFNLARSNGGVLVVANFDAAPQYLNLDSLGTINTLCAEQLKDLISGEAPAIFKNQLVIPPFHSYWLTEQNRNS